MWLRITIHMYRAKQYPFARVRPTLEDGCTASIVQGAKMVDFFPNAIGLVSIHIDVCQSLRQAFT
jgi:hypothetical protein